MRTRRDFLKFFYNTSIAVTLAPLLTPSQVSAATIPSDDYKALVYIYLEGGNDAFNMFMPTETAGKNGYDNFASNRGSLAVGHTDFSDKLALAAVKDDGNGGFDLDFTANGNPYPSSITNPDVTYLSGMYHIADTGVGVHALMPELAHMIDQGKAAGIMTVGTLIKPLMASDGTRLSGPKPPYLFSHNSQQRLQDKGVADKRIAQGWVGRLFDEWPGVNPSVGITDNISFGGNSYALRGKNSAPLALSGTPSSYEYITSPIADDEKAARIELAGHTSGNIFKEHHRKITERSFTLADEIQTIWDNAPTFSGTNAYGEPLMSTGNESTLGLKGSGKLMSQLNNVLKMLKYGQANGLKRQVFYVKYGGFDSHANQTLAHAKHLRELSMALSDFQRATEELGLGDKVTAFTLSDFGRSVGGNSDGTDHAWAGHNIVVGGALNSGKFYGEFPNWDNGGEQDASGRGRVIPTLAVEQQLATITKWFGADDVLNDSLFPNLKNFSARDLGFMQTV